MGAGVGGHLPAASLPNALISGQCNTVELKLLSKVTDSVILIGLHVKMTLRQHSITSRLKGKEATLKCPIGYSQLTGNKNGGFQSPRWLCCKIQYIVNV